MLFWFLFAPIVSVLSTNKVCPGGSFSCPDTATCCQLVDKSYGCCPFEKAVCCDDHIHCCPENTKCEAGTCVQHHGINVTAERLSAKYKDITCFGSKFVCPDNSTCCRGDRPGTYGCCLLKHAVCCSDGLTCCPEGTFCATEGCIGKSYISEMYDSQKTGMLRHSFAEYLSLSKPNNVSSVICPDSSFQCPNGYTCCQLLNGDWGCCPFVKATCCKDHIHCCPQNMHCDPTSKSCSQGLASVPVLFKEISKPVNIDITCPDNSTCAESMTCCKLNNKHYGCCPYTDAVCCEDHRHCCPNGFICDDVQKRCQQKMTF